MANTQPLINGLNVITASPVNQYILDCEIGTLAALPSGTGYANIFGLNCTLNVRGGAVQGSYLMTGTVASPAWTLVGGAVSSKVLTDLGTTQNSTPTPAQLLGGIVQQTGATGAGTFTLPTGTALSAAVPGVQVGDSFQTTFLVNGGGQTITVTGVTGSTVLGTAAVPTGKATTLTFINTGTNTWNVYSALSA